MRRSWLGRGLLLVVGVGVLGVIACLSVAVGAASSGDSLAETVQTGDAVTVVAGASSSVGEDVTPVDAVTAVSGASSSIPETVTTADAVSAVTGQSSTVTESVVPSDTVVVRKGETANIAENVSPSDTVTFQVVNSPPALVLPSSIQASEGQAITGGGSFVDPDVQTWTATVSWGDGTPAQALPLASNKTFAFNHAYDDNTSAGYTITVTISDGVSSTTGTVHVDVANVSPTADLASGGPVDEGSPATITFSNQLDPSNPDTAAGFTYAYDCGAGYGAPVQSPTATCTFDDQGSYAVKGKIADKDGGSTERTTSVTVQNVAPTATFTVPAAVDEGAPIGLDLSGAQDPSAADTTAGFTYAFDCGDGAGFGALGAPSTASCPTTDNGTRNVRGKVQDKDGGSTIYSATVVVRNIPPTATFHAPASANEGEIFSISLTNPADPSAADTSAGFTYSFNCGAGYSSATSTPSAQCTALNDPGVDVRARIADKDGGATEYTAHVAIANRPPVVQVLGPPAGSAYPVGTTVALSGSFTDPGRNDTHTAVWSLDALSTPGAVTESSGSGTVAGAFTFTTPGVYSVVLTVRDNGNATGTAATVGGAPALIVIFDPNSGQVTGGGWVPATGQSKTSFQFSAKYQKGVLSGSVVVTLPNGQVVSSTSLSWLVVSGSKTQIRGDATVAGVSGYSFLLTATQSPYAFRLKVWRTTGGAVVYDNVPGASDDIDLATPQALGGGTITVH